METGDETAEHLEMAAVKEGNCTLAADDINWWISQIDCPCQWQFVIIYPVILHCHYYIIASQIGHRVEPYELSSVEIFPSTYSVKKDSGKLLQMRDEI